MIKLPSGGSGLLHRLLTSSKTLLRFCTGPNQHESITTIAWGGSAYSSDVFTAELSLAGDAVGYASNVFIIRGKIPGSRATALTVPKRSAKGPPGATRKWS